MLAPVPFESADQIALVDGVRRSIFPEWKFTHPASGEHRSKAVAMKLKNMGVNRGWPDLMFFGTRAPFVFFLELKRRRGGRETPEQIELREHLTRCGFRVHVTNSIQDAAHQLYTLRIIRARVFA